MNIQDTKPHHARAVVAVAFDGTSIILATDSNWVACEIDAISNSAEEIGMIGHKEDAGVYLWEGTLRVEWSGAPMEPEEPDTTYTGKLRPITPDEWPALLDMSPPYAHDPDDGRDTPIRDGGQTLGP